MPDLALTFTRLTGGDGADRLLVVGPSLGTGVADLWGRCAALLPPTWQVVGWDLPGHGAGAPTTDAFEITDLAAVVRDRAARLAEGRRAAYAGVSLGGAVGFTLAVDPGPFDAVITLASAPKIGTPDGWRARAATVREAGTVAVVDGSAVRWFAPGFRERDPATAKLAPLVAGGAHDVVVPPDQVDVVLTGVAHLPPAEDPVATAALITDFLWGTP